MKVMQRKPFATSSAAGPKCRLAQLQATPKNASSHSRRDTLLEGASLLALPLLLSSKAAEAKEVRPGRSLIEVKNLNSFQKKAEKEALLAIVESELRKEITPEDAPDALRLVLRDAGTYDVQSGTGGINGSIFLEEELSRPENADIKPIAEKLQKIRSSIQQRFEKNGFALISLADLEVIATKVAFEKDWSAIKRKNGVPSQGDIIASAFGAAWPIRIGRTDATQPDPAGRVPGNDASVKDITTFFAKLNNKDYGATGFFAPKPFFDYRQAFVLFCSSQKDIVAAEQRFAADPELGKKYGDFKYKYERSRDTVTRTEYEVDFIEFFNALTQLGANFDADKYYVPIEIDTPKF